MTEARVRAPYRAVYSDPIRLRAGERLALHEERPSEWEGWVWGTSLAGLTGWVPKAYLRSVDEAWECRCDYDARELSADTGAPVLVEKEESGWLWCRTPSGECGWLPRENVDLG